MTRRRAASSLSFFSVFASRAACLLASGIGLVALVDCGGAVAETASDAGPGHVGVSDAGGDGRVQPPGVVPGEDAQAPITPPDPPQCPGTSSSPGHRPVEVACTRTTTGLPPADAGPASCNTLADCTPAGLGYKACLDGQCSFDGCLVDTDCPTGQACGCADQFGGNAIHYNACVPAQCRTDADCGPGRTCSPSTGSYCGSLTGLYCHTAADTCTTDANCCSDPAQTRCFYDAALGHFDCQAQTVCGG